MATIKKEAVTVSFHYLLRTEERESGPPAILPFSQAAFDNLFTALKGRPEPDLSKEEVANRLRVRHEAVIAHVERVNERTIFGTFKGAYWGHAYDNTAKGRIPADSISLRPFHFLLYRSDGGKLFIGSQYLGLFGGYIPLQRTICGLLGDPDAIASRSFRLGGGAYKDAKPKEIRVSYASKPKSIASHSTVGSTGMIVFKKGRRDDGFEEEVSKKLFPALGKSQSEVKKAVAALASQSELLEVQDSDIEDCTVVALVNGKRQVIHMLDEGSFATRFPLDVPLDTDGHPVADKTRAAMLKMLKDEIIARTESV